MTTPVPHGFPDWARQSAVADIEVIYLVGESIASGTTYGPFFVGSMPHLRVFQSAGAQGSTTRLDWFADEAATKGLGSDSIVTNANGSAVQSVSVVAPWVKVRVDLIAYPNTHNLQVFMTFRGAAQQSGPAANNTLLTRDAVSVAAGATNTSDSLTTRGGWAYWHARLEDATAYRIKLFSLDRFGATRLLDFVDSGTNIHGNILFLPAAPVRVTSLNNDAVARDLYLTVLHLPFAQ